MNAIGIIPARYNSIRFPGKPLINIKGKSMIQRVFEQASSCSLLSEVFVATDDQRIFDHVVLFGGKVVMTSEKHKSGTDRCNEATEKILTEKNPQDIVVNIQGDEPFLDPHQIELLLSCFSKDPFTQISTLIKKITNSSDLFNPNIVKIVTNYNTEAIYFSRQAIPYFRETEKEEWVNSYNYYKHIGIYAYRLDILNQITKLHLSNLEMAENLEQLRWIDNGFTIKTIITNKESIAIDSPEDLKKITDKV